MVFAVVSPVRLAFSLPVGQHLLSPHRFRSVFFAADQNAPRDCFQELFHLFSVVFPNAAHRFFRSRDRKSVV